MFQKKTVTIGTIGAGYAAGLHREALIATGVVLFVFILIINVLFSLIKKGESK